jgi:hypothetical protein
MTGNNAFCGIIPCCSPDRRIRGQALYRVNNYNRDSAIRKEGLEICFGSWTCDELRRKFYPQSLGKAGDESLFHFIDRHSPVEFLLDAGNTSFCAASGDDLCFERGVISDQDRTMLEKGAGQSALGAADDLLVVHDDLIPRGRGKTGRIF